MRIAQVLWLGSIGGLENYVYQLSEGLTENKHIVDVCVLHVEGDISDKIKNKNIKVFCAGMKNGFDFYGAFKFLQFLLKNNYDIVHVHDRNLLANFLLLFYPGKKIFTEHGGELLSWKNWKRRFFYHFLSAQFDVIIANSNFVKDSLLRLKILRSDKIITVYNGIYAERFSNALVNKNKIRDSFSIPPSAKVVGIVARLVEAKGIDLFIETAGKIMQQRDDVIFLIAGDGPLREECERLAAKIKYPSNIRFLGWQSDILHVLPAFDIFLFTSRWEPFGMVLLEAMAVGVPVVGFNVPGANEVAINGETAILVDSFDLEALASKTIDVLDNVEYCAQLGNNGRRRVNDFFTMDINTSRVTSIVERL
jgi:glycosyltransferase involved in cell wall biosynthesis